MSLAGEDKMTQKISIATGCAAGATESFVVCQRLGPYPNRS